VVHGLGGIGGAEAVGAEGDHSVNPMLAR
jgi:hypothetical protein